MIRGVLGLRFPFLLFLLLFPAACPRHSPSHLGPGRTAEGFPLGAGQTRAAIQADGLRAGSEAFGAHSRVCAAEREITGVGG